MVNSKQNRIEVRGLSVNEIDFLKAQAQRAKSKSFNEFLLSMCREKIEKGKFNFEGKEYDAKIIVETKKEFNSNFITIDELISKYTNLKKEDKFIYSINGEVANATEKNILVDEKYIMQIKVVKLDKVEENLNFIKILTRSKQNLNNANEIIIRGNEISMNE